MAKDYEVSIASSALPKGETHIDVEVYYDKGINPFGTGAKRGYKARVTTHREYVDNDGIKFRQISIGDGVRGVYVFLEPAERKNPHRLRRLAERILPEAQRITGAFEEQRRDDVTAIIQQAAKGDVLAETLEARFR